MQFFLDKKNFIKLLKGVLGYTLTKPDDWDLYISEVVKMALIKRKSLSIL